jgi:hypothetical protein
MARWALVPNSQRAGRKDNAMPPKKKISPQTPFLTSAAEAIGAALGKLAVKTGVAAPTAASKKKSKAPAAKKKAKSPAKKAVKKSAR